MLCHYFVDHLINFPFSVNRESSSPAPTDNASAMGTQLASEETTLTSNYTSTTIEDPPDQEIQESMVSSEHSECIPSVSTELGSEARSILDPDSSNSGNSSAFDKLRQPDGCVESVRQQSGNANTESLPSGYVKVFF